MPKDWAKSRTQLLNELKQLRKVRDKLAHPSAHSPESGAEDVTRLRLDTLCRVTGALSGTATLAEATPALLGELAQCGGWEAGILWLTREPDDILQFTGGWSVDGVLFQDLESLSRQSTFLPGRGPLGHFWGNGKQSTIFDLNLENRSPRSLYAVRAGLHWATLFPLWHRERLLGFFEFFSKKPTSSDGEQAKLLAASGQQVVQRLLRERAEQQCHVLEAPACPELAVIELDASGRIVRWSKDAERLNGFEAGEVLGQHISLLYAESEGECADHNLESAATRGVIKDSGWRLHRGAERFWAEVIILPKRAPHGELVGFTKVVHRLPEAAAFPRETRVPSEAAMLEPEAEG